MYGSKKGCLSLGPSVKQPILQKVAQNTPYDTPILSSGSVLQAQRGGSLFEAGSSHQVPSLTLGRGS